MKSKKLKALLVALVVGTVLTFVSQYVIKNQTNPQSECVNSNGTATSCTTDSNTFPTSVQAVTKKGFPIAFINNESLANDPCSAISDVVCTQEETITQKPEFVASNFVYSLVINSFVLLLLILALESILKRQQRTR